MKREPDILWSFLIYWYSYQKIKSAAIVHNRQIVTLYTNINNLCRQLFQPSLSFGILTNPQTPH